MDLSVGHKFTPLCMRGCLQGLDGFVSRYARTAIILHRTSGAAKTFLRRRVCGDAENSTSRERGCAYFTGESWQSKHSK